MFTRLPFWSIPVDLAVALALLFGTATAQGVPPTLTMTDAAVFEGNAGTRALTFNVTLSSSTNVTVTAQLSAIPLSNATTGGGTCSAGVDFIQLNNVPFSIPANTTTAIINVTVCGDTQIEPDQSIFVALTNVAGAQCFEGTCNGVGVIRNDDGPPGVSINNVFIMEGPAGTRTAVFRVSLSHPSQQNTTVNFATRNGTARGATACLPFITGGFSDYISRSGTLTIPPDTLSATIGVTVCGDNISEGDQTFFVDLSNPTPVGVTITDATGQGTIRDFGLTGEFELSPQTAQVRPGEPLTYTVVWTVPDGEVWRDLNTIDLRIGKTVLWVRWDEATNTFSLCRRGGGQNRRDDEEDHDHDGSSVFCGPGATPGSDVVLETPGARLHLADSSAVGSGPTGPSVTLTLAISFTARAAGRSYGVELAATDDLGRQDPFRQGGTVHVERVSRRR